MRSRGGGAAALAWFVTGRRRRALDLFLLAHAVASAPPWDVGLESTVWARLLGVSGSTVGSTISRQWTWLEQNHLITTKRVGGVRAVTLLREDGSGTPYTHPGQSSPGRDAEGRYFALPHAYWRMGLQDQLDLATKAVLLIALSREDRFILPHDHAAKWYGVSPDTIRTGLRTLEHRGLLTVDFIHTKAPLSPSGTRTERRYTLRPPFGPRGFTSSPADTA